MSLSVTLNDVKCLMKPMRSVNKKVHAAFKHDLTPIMCVGETLEQRETDETSEIIA